MPQQAPVKDVGQPYPLCKAIIPCVNGAQSPSVPNVRNFITGEDAMHITPLAKSYFKSIARDADSPDAETWLPLIGWNGTELVVDAECPWRAAAGVSALPPMFIKVELGFKNVPYLLIEPDSEAFFRNAILDYTKDGQLTATHQQNPNSVCR